MRCRPCSQDLSRNGCLCCHPPLRFGPPKCGGETRRSAALVGWPSYPLTNENIGGKEIRKGRYYSVLGVPQRRRAASCAIFFRCSGVRESARARPPFKPPLRPRATAAGSLCGSMGAGVARSSTWPVRMSPISFPSWTGSRGRGRRLAVILLVCHARRQGPSRTTKVWLALIPVASDCTIRRSGPSPRRERHRLKRTCFHAQLC